MDANVLPYQRRRRWGLQLDFTATPRFNNGVIFPWTAYDYPLRHAIDDGIVKRPLKGLAHFDEAASDHAPTRYAGYLAAVSAKY